MVERSSFVVKPENLHLRCEMCDFMDGRLGGRYHEVYDGGLIEPVPAELFEILYGHIKGDYPEAYADSFQAFTSGGIFVRRYWGTEGLVSEMRKILGPLDPSVAGPETIRGKFCTDSLALSKAEGRCVKNGGHASDSPERGVFECRLFGKYLGLEGD